MVLGPERRGIKVAYCTDTRPVPVIAEYAREADLLICEGMYGEDGKESKAREYKHIDVYKRQKKKIIQRDNPYTTFALEEVIEDSYKRLIAPAIEREVRNQLTEAAEELSLIHI